VPGGAGGGPLPTTGVAVGGIVAPGSADSSVQPDCSYAATADTSRAPSINFASKLTVDCRMASA
jgi:hypothetical protein